MKNLILIFSFILFSDLTFSQGLSEQEKSFENFWHVYEDNYAFFNFYSLDWKQQYNFYRNKVNAKTNEKELMNMFKEMLNPLNDGHSYIFKGDSNIYHTPYKCSFDNEFPNKEVIDSLWNVSYHTLESNHFLTVQGYGPKVRGNSLYFASTSDNIGYIRISRFHGELKALFDDNFQLIDSIKSITLFDSLLAKMIDKKALIIDLRNNNGGNGWSYDLARRFIDNERVSHYINIRQKGSH
ncbi:MAG: S41 family peptidase, partial [Thermoplasmata archaeon]